MILFLSCPRWNYNPQRISKITIDLGQIASVSLFQVQRQCYFFGELLPWLSGVTWNQESLTSPLILPLSTALLAFSHFLQVGMCVLWVCVCFLVFRLHTLPWPFKSMVLTTAKAGDTAHCLLKDAFNCALLPNFVLRKQGGPQKKTKQTNKNCYVPQLPCRSGSQDVGREIDTGIAEWSFPANDGPGVRSPWEHTFSLPSLPVSCLECRRCCTGSSKLGTTKR